MDGNTTVGVALQIKIVPGYAAEFRVLLHVISVSKVLAEKEGVHSVSARQVKALTIGRLRIDELCFVACGEFGGTLFAGEPDGVPPIGYSRKRRQFVCGTLTSFFLLQEPPPLIVGEVFVFIALQR